MESSVQTRHGAARSAPALVVVMLAGCAVGPDYTRPEAPVRGSWHQKAAEQLDTRAKLDVAWWRTFDDRALDALVDLAYQQNLDLQLAGLRIIEARAQLGIASGRLWPQQQQAFASVHATRLGPTPVVASNIGGTFANFQAGFDALWELDLWGKYRRGIEAESANVVASEASYEDALISLTAEVARTYVTIRTYEVLIDLAQQNTRVQEEGLTIATARFKNGATSELDVAQATALLETTRASVPPLVLALQQAQNALSTLLGQPVGVIEQVVGGAKTIPSAPAKVGLGVPAELLERRPDVRAAELYAAAQCARIGVAKADLFPSISLSGTIGYRATTITPVSSNPLSDIFFSIGPQVNWPFLNYGRLTSAVRVQDARFEQLIVGYRSAVLRAAQEVEDALVGVGNSQEQVAAEERAVTAAQRSVDIALVQYREGAVDYQRVLDAQRTLLQRQNGLANARSSVATNLIALYKALGGGWEERRGAPIVAPVVEEEMHRRTSWGGLISQPLAPQPTTLPARR